MFERHEMSEEEGLHCWQTARDGDRKAMAELLRQHQDLIFRFCHSRLGDHSTAIEATQETAVRMIDHIIHFEGRGKLTTWILGIANNVCREQQRLKQKWHQHDEEENPTLNDSENQLDPLIESENTEQLNRAFGQLPERQREAILLRYFESLSLAEVGQIMDVSTGTVKATLSHAITKLKIKFDQIR